MRQRFEGVIGRFRTGGQWPVMPREFGACATVHDRRRQWRHADVFEALLEGLISQAAKRGDVELSLAGVDSTTASAHHGAAVMHLAEYIITAQEMATARRRRPDKARRGRLEERGGPGGPAGRRWAVGARASGLLRRRVVQGARHRGKTRQQDQGLEGPATRFDKRSDSYTVGLELRGPVICSRRLHSAT
ncbi:transposase [Streptomyces sp. NBC_00876]|uniref:transposase n=1 Tax=Streptomyces sp. NBC_00876 TaxID=2975853 RepID=UPI00386EB00C